MSSAVLNVNEAGRTPEQQREWMRELVMEPRYKWHRLEAKLERARRQRDEWRKKQELLQAEIVAVRTIWQEREQKRLSEQARAAIQERDEKLKRIDFRIGEMTLRYYDLHQDHRRALLEVDKLRKELAAKGGGA